jgi:PKD repeat protein
VNLLPTPKATYKQSSGVNDFNVKFDASTSTDTEAGQLTYVWDFDTSVDSNGDGKPANDVDSSSAMPTFNYKKEGTYTARLTAIDADNGTSTTTIEVKVRAVSIDNNGMLYLALGIIIIGAVAGAAIYASRRKKKFDVIPRARDDRLDLPPQSTGTAQPDQTTMRTAPSYGASVATPAYYADSAPSSGAYPAYEAAPQESGYGTSPYGGAGESAPQPQEGLPEAPAESAPAPAPAESTPEPPAPEPAPEPEPALPVSTPDRPPEAPKPEPRPDDLSEILKRLDSIKKK